MAEFSHRDAVDACLLSFVAGFVDTCVFVGLFGLFTAHVTGNLALIGAQLVHHDGEVLAKLLSLPAFVLAVVGTVHAAHWLKRRGRRRVAPVLCAEAVLLLLSIGVAASFGPGVQPDDLLPLTAGVLAAAAMGMQNALMRVELASLPSTTVMTVNVTQVVIDAVIIAGGQADDAVAPQERHESRQRFARMWPPVAAFTAGAACGAGGYAWVAMWSLLIPVALCGLLALRFARH